MIGAWSPTGRPRTTALLLALALLAGALPAHAQSLRGSRASLDRQNRVAREHDFTFLRTASQVRTFGERGWLVRVTPNRDFSLHAVSFPYARPEVATFVERLASQYRQACGEKLVVTSLTRPISRQPSNASARSVHPTGMAVDLRWSSKTACRRWLEDTLLDLEKTRVLEATRERYPAHYHVALFPRQYESYLDRLQTRLAQAEAGSAAAAAGAAYRVRPGDSLWTIARRTGVTVEQLKQRNDLPSSRIYAGQVIQLPVAR